MARDDPITASGWLLHKIEMLVITAPRVYPGEAYRGYFLHGRHFAKKDAGLGDFEDSEAGRRVQMGANVGGKGADGGPQE